VPQGKKRMPFIPKRQTEKMNPAFFHPNPSMVKTTKYFAKNLPSGPYFIYK
jgi:hypothetical protein